MMAIAELETKTPIRTPAKLIYPPEWHILPDEKKVEEKVKEAMAGLELVFKKKGNLDFARALIEGADEKYLLEEKEPEKIQGYNNFYSELAQDYVMTGRLGPKTIEEQGGTLREGVSLNLLSESLGDMAFINSRFELSPHESRAFQIKATEHIVHALIAPPQSLQPDERNRPKYYFETENRLIQGEVKRIA